jgi:endoglucanase
MNIPLRLARMRVRRGIQIGGWRLTRAGWLTLLVLGAAISTAVAPPAAAESGVRFGRGIAISAMAWAAIEPDSAKAFAFPPFVGPLYTLAPDELQTLLRSGFDFVRLAVDPGPFLQFQGTRRAALDRMLTERVQLILASGLGVIVDFHPSDMHPDYTAEVLTAGLQTALFQSYLRMLQETAQLLGQLHSQKVALELMNEPPVSPQAWQPMLDAAYAAARSGSADLPLLLEGGGEASAAALMAMRNAVFAKDGAVWFSFHYYDSYQFTHQGASWNAARYLADVPYPARARPLDDSLIATAALIKNSGLSAPQQALAYRDARTRLEDYRSSAFDRTAIATAFERIARWAQAQGIASERVMLGEFGARETALQLFGARANERAQWFRDVRQAAEAQGFGWAVWVYRGQGFSLAPEPGNTIEAPIADALGLDSSAARQTALPGQR